MSKNVKSILTTAMLNADGTKENDQTDTTETTDPVAAYEKKRLFRAVGIVAVTCVVTYVAVKLLGSPEDEDTNETPED